MNEVVFRPTFFDIFDKFIILFGILLILVFSLLISFNLISVLDLTISFNNIKLLLFILVFIFLDWLLLIYLKSKINEIINFCNSKILINTDKIFLDGFFSDNTKITFSLNDISGINIFKYYKTSYYKGSKVTSEQGLFLKFVFIEGFIHDEFSKLLEKGVDNNILLFGKGQLKKLVNYIEKNYPQIKIEKSLFWSKEIK